jgi:RIMS-binding protein 2
LFFSISLPPPPPPPHAPPSDGIVPFQRMFVVIFPYDPYAHDNPDPEAELPLLEGQVVKVFGDKDEDGFYMAELNGRRGLIPSNFVEEVDIMQDGEEEEVPAEDEDGDMAGEEEVLPPGSVVIALYDYDPQELSPNETLDEELSFAAGDIMIIRSPMDEDGFYVAEHRLTGKVS